MTDYTNGSFWVQTPQTGAKTQLLTEAANTPTEIPAELRAKAAKVKNAKEAQAVVEEFRKLRAGDQVDHEELIAVVREAELAEFHKKYADRRIKVVEELRDAWAKVLGMVAPLSMGDLKATGADQLRLPAPVRKALIDLDEEFQVFRGLLTEALNYAKVIHLPTGFQGDGWRELALLTDIPGETPEDYEQAHYAYLNVSNPASVRASIDKAEELAYTLTVRSAEEAQASLDGWDRNKSLFLVEGNTLYRKDKLGSHMHTQVTRTGIAERAHRRFEAAQIQAQIDAFRN